MYPNETKAERGKIVYEPNDGLSTKSRSIAAFIIAAKAGVPGRHGENENGMLPIAPDEATVVFSGLQDISMLTQEFGRVEELKEYSLVPGRVLLLFSLTGEDNTVVEESALLR